MASTNQLVTSFGAKFKKHQHTLMLREIHVLDFLGNSLAPDV